MSVLLVAFVAACRGSSGDELPPTAGSSPTPLAGVGGAPPEYPQPVLLVPGDYVPPSASRQAEEKFAEALEASRAQPQFSGVVNGFRVYSWEEAAADPAKEQQECVAVQFKEVAIFRAHYLPPGTYARSPQYAGVCADGSTAWVNQDFQYGYGTFSIGYELGERAIGTDATADRVKAGEVNGRPAVFIEPIIEEGNGQSIIAFAMDKGFIVIGATGLPLTETLKIAENITCDGC